MAKPRPVAGIDPSKRVRPNARRIVSRLRVFQMQIAERALDLQPIFADGLKLRTARDEMYLVAGRREPRAEITAHGSRCHDSDAHRALP